MDDSKALEATEAVVAKLLSPLATYNDMDVARFLATADRWAKAPAELGEWLSKRLMVYTQVLDHLILHPPAGADGLVAVLRSANLQMKTAVVIHEAMVRLKLKEAVPANARAKVTGRPAHRGRSGRRSPVGS